MRLKPDYTKRTSQQQGRRNTHWIKAYLDALRNQRPVDLLPREQQRRAI